MQKAFLLEKRLIDRKIKENEDIQFYERNKLA